MKTSAVTALPSVRRPREIWAATQGALREHRQVRREYRALANDLAHDSNTAHFNDLLAAVDRQDSSDADMIRRIVSGARRGR